MNLAVETMTDQTTVLVIEDDQEINELLGEYLTLENVQYAQALTGKAGIERVAAIHPSAVILDLMLPDIDGYQVAREITSHRATYDTPILMLTCMNQDCDRQKGYAAGALQYLNKPFLPDDLLAAVQGAIAWRKSVHTRPPQGTINIGPGLGIEMAKAINNMCADLFCRTTLSDDEVARIRSAIEDLAGWVAEWGKNKGHKSQLTIHYRILAGAAISNGSPATDVEWTLAEPLPGFLEEAFGKSATHVVASPQQSGFSLTGTLAWAFGRSGDKSAEKSGEKATAVAEANLPPNAAGTSADWSAFLIKLGAATFDRDPARRIINITRPLPKH
jgi:CheY-like chemotaxis protein